MQRAAPSKIRRPTTPLTDLLQRGARAIDIAQKILEALMLPPGGPVLLGVLGLILAAWKIPPGRTLVVLSIVTMYASSIPITSAVLNRLLQEDPALSFDEIKRVEPDVILLLAGGIYSDAPEYRGDTVALRTLGRTRYAAMLSKKLKLPILISGGYRHEDGKPEAELIKEVLLREFGVRDTLLEIRSKNTLENAHFSAKIMEEAGKSRALLVTQAAHMKRAAESFRNAEVNVIPAPTMFFGNKPEPEKYQSWLPDATSAYRIRYALHEIVGLWWYRLITGMPAPKAQPQPS